MAVSKSLILSISGHGYLNWVSKFQLKLVNNKDLYSVQINIYNFPKVSIENQHNSVKNFVKKTS